MGQGYDFEVLRVRCLADVQAGSLQPNCTVERLRSDTVDLMQEAFGFGRHSVPAASLSADTT